MDVRYNVIESMATVKFCSLRISLVETAKHSFVTTFHNTLEERSCQKSEQNDKLREIMCCRWIFISHTLSCIKFFFYHSTLF